MLHLLGKKLAKETLFLLHDGDYRFNHLQEVLGCAPRSLSILMKELVDKGLVNRVAFAEIPPHVEYSLTNYGTEIYQWLLNMPRN